MKEDDLLNPSLSKKINLNDDIQINTLAKLFNCTFDEIYETIINTEGTFQDLIDQFGNNIK